MAVRWKQVRWKRVIAIDLVLIAAWLFTVVGFWRLIDLVDISEQRALVTEEVRAVTGRELVLAGAAELRLSLEPTITINDIAFANAEWGSSPWMITASKIEAQVRLIPLLFGRLDIKRITLVDPEVLIETNADGVGNWEMIAASGGDGDSDANEEPGAFIPAIKEVVLEHGRVTVRDGEAGTTTVISVDRLLAEGHGFQAPLEIEASGRYDDTAFSLEGTLGSIAGLSADAPFPIDLTGEIADIRISLEGRIGEPLAGRGIDIRVTAEGDSFLALSDRIGWSYPEIGPYSASFRLLGSAGGQFRITDMTAELGHEDEEFASVTGSIGNVIEGTGLELDIVVRARTLERIGEIFDLPLAPAGPVEARGTLRDSNGVHVVEDVRATVRDSDATGKFTVEREGGRLLLVIEATSEFLDVAYLAGIEAPGPFEPGDRLFSDAYLYLDQLDVIDLLIGLRVERVKFHEHRLAEVTLDYSMDRGTMIARLFEGRYFGGSLTGEIVVTPGRERPQVTAAMELSGMDFGRYLAEYEITDLVEGAANIALDVTGGGTDLRAIMAGLTGQASFVMGEGRINSAYVDFLAADLLRAISVTVSDEDSTAVNCFVGMFDIADGMAKSDGFLFDTQRMTVAGKGTVNLKDETLDLSLRPRPKDASLLSLATPLNVEGTIREPSTSTDKLAIAGTAATAVISAIATGGVGAIVPFLSLGSDDENPCVLAIADPHSIGKQLDTTPDEAPADRNEAGGRGGDTANAASDGSAFWSDTSDDPGEHEGDK